MDDQTVKPPPMPPPPIPLLRTSPVYVAIWKPGYPPMKAKMNFRGFPKWKPISVDEYLMIAEKWRSRIIIAEQASVDREFGHEAVGL